MACIVALALMGIPEVWSCSTLQKSLRWTLAVLMLKLMVFVYFEPMSFRN